MTYKIEFVAGEHHPKRSVCFLISDDKKINAKREFDKLSKKNDSKEKALRSRFDWWRDNQPNKPHRYHGWDKSEFGGKFTKCFVFKANPHRLYGFLTNPKPSDQSYQICALVCHAEKNKHESDETDLKRVEKFRTIMAIQKAIKKKFKGK